MFKILIVEDEEVNMKLASDILSMNGYHILQACNGEEGVRIAKIEQPNLILMDIEMPVMDGMEAIGHLKSDLKTSKIIIIALTAVAMIGSEKIIRAAGADDYLAKPYSYNDLLEVVKKNCPDC